MNINQDKIQYILIGILMAGMFAIGLGVYVTNQQVRMISDSIKTMQQGRVDVSTPSAALPVVSPPQFPPILPKKVGWINSCDAATQSISIGLCFDYPSHWILTPYEDEFRPQYREFFLTSSRGRLLAAISSGGPAQAEEGVAFESGYDIRIVTTPLDEPEEFLGLGSKVAGYSSLYQPLNACEGAGCPIEHYFFREDPNGKLFEILINYSGVPDNEVRAKIGTFLNSLKQEP